MTHNAAADPSTDGDMSRGAVLRSIRGGKGYGSSGRLTTSHATSSIIVVDKQPPTYVGHIPSSPPVTISPPNVQNDLFRSQGEDFSHLSSLPPNPTTQITPFHKPPNLSKDIRSTSPTPILRSSLYSSSPSLPLKNHSSHVNMVGKSHCCS